MSKKDDGGPAFPVPQERNTDGSVTAWTQFGMSLRDYFAGQAIAAIIMERRYSLSEVIAERAYLLADAMLEARSKD